MLEECFESRGTENCPTFSHFCHLTQYRHRKSKPLTRFSFPIMSFPPGRDLGCQFCCLDSTRVYECGLHRAPVSFSGWNSHRRWRDSRRRWPSRLRPRRGVPQHWLHRGPLLWLPFDLIFISQRFLFYPFSLDLPFICRSDLVISSDRTANWALDG
jgi:hypothetical protein